MKRIIALLLLTITLVNACKKDEDEELKKKSAFLNVYVTDFLNRPVKNKSVYLFEEHTYKVIGLKPIHSHKTSVTDNKGVAKFELIPTFDLDIINPQTTFYVAVYDSEEVADFAGVTIRHGETKELELNY